MPTMTAQTGTLTTSQLAAYARAAGFPEKEIPTAVAVARAESQGNPRARNAVPCIGLWQINMRGTMGPARRKALGINSNEALYDPAINARAAYMIWKNAGWKPWSTFTSGSYRKYLSETPKDAGTPLNADDVKEKVLRAQEKAKEAANPLYGVLGRIDRLTETFRRQSWNWLIVTLALVLLVLGILILNRARLKRVAKVGVGVATKGVVS